MRTYIFGEASPRTGNKTPNAQRQSDGYFIPFDQDNRDCIQFLTEWKAGATVTNADGSPAPYSEESVISLGLTPIAPAS